MARKVAATHGCMSGHNDGQISLVALCCHVKQILKEIVRHIPFADIRNGNDISLTGNVDNQIFKVFGVNVANGIYLQGFPWRFEYIMLCAAIMVACCYDNRHIRVGIMYFDKGIGKHSLNRCRRLRSMINIATKQKYIRLLFVHDFHHLNKHSHLFLCSVVIVKRMTKVPIAGM